MSVEEVGKIYFLTYSWFNWNIPSFSLLSQKLGRRIWSPSFAYNDNSMKCGLCRDGWEVPQQNSLGIIFSSTDTNETPIKCIRFGMADMTNTEVSYWNVEWIGRDHSVKNGYFKVPKIATKEKLKQLNSRKEQSRFRLFCEALSTQRCQIINTSTQTDKVFSRDASTNTILDDDTGNNNKPNEVICNDLQRPERIIQNLEDLYVEGKHSDLIIKVKDRKFKVHKAILTVRSSVFDRMFLHDLLESNTGIVPIEDCDPAVFEEFLIFIYTGRTQHLSSDNMCELYYLADKYDIPELKEECIDFLQKSLTVDTICDVICLSTKHDETGLLELAINFIAKNMEEILLTVKWQTFMRENPTEANELYIKALKLGYTKNNQAEA